MEFTDSSALIVSTIADFGIAALAVLTAIIAVAVGLLVFRWGASKMGISFMSEAERSWRRRHADDITD